MRSIFFARSLDLVLIKYFLPFKDTFAKFSEFIASLIFSGEAFSPDFFNLNSKFLSRRKAKKQMENLENNGHLFWKLSDT